MSHSRFERREKVHSLLIQGFTEKEIAEKLGVSRRTIVRDIAYFRDQAQIWVENQAKGEFVFHMQLALEKLQDSEREYNKLFEEAKTIEDKLKILKAKENNLALQTQILGEGPTLLGLNRIVAKRKNLSDTEVK